MRTYYFIYLCNSQSCKEFKKCYENKSSLNTKNLFVKGNGTKRDSYSRSYYTPSRNEEFIYSKNKKNYVYPFNASFYSHIEREYFKKYKSSSLDSYESVYNKICSNLYDMDLNSNEDLFKITSSNILSLTSNINLNNLNKNIYIFNPLNINIIQREEQECYLFYNYNFFINDNLIVKEDKTKVLFKDNPGAIYDSISDIWRYYDKESWFEENKVKLNILYPSTNKNWSLTKTKSYLYCNKDKNVIVNNITLNESSLTVKIPYSLHISNLKIVNNSKMKCHAINFSNYYDNERKIVIDTLDLSMCKDNFTIESYFPIIEINKIIGNPNKLYIKNSYTIIIENMDYKKYLVKNTINKIKDKHFYLVGKVSCAGSDYYKEKIKKVGGIIDNSLNKNINYIILGKSKLTNALLNAQKLGITIIDKELTDIWIDMYTQE